MEITCKNLEHIYQKGTPFERRALYDVNLSTPSNKLISVIGQTGSGKSTLIQHINGLLFPTAGTIQVGTTMLKSSTKKKVIRSLRKRVGIVFQNPEQQLFAETVEDDICFGPINFGMTKEEARYKAKEAIKHVGLSEDFLDKSPFDLSGGQMRRVAIAGILVMNPEVLILDEPTAGLDPVGKRMLMKMFTSMKKDRDITIVLVTHSMEDAATYSDEIIVMNQGTVFLKGTPNEIFLHADQLVRIGLDIPEALQLVKKIEEKFNIQLQLNHYTNAELIEVIKSTLKKGAGQL